MPRPPWRDGRSPVRRRNTSSSVGRARATETTLIPRPPRRRGSRARRHGIRDGDGQQAVLERRRGHPRLGAQARREPLHRVGLAGLGLDPPHGQRVAVEEVGELALDDEPAVIEDPDPVADPLDVGEDVGREQHGRLATERRDEVEDVPPALRVEGADRLVEDDDGRPMDERARRSRAAGASRPSRSPRGGPRPTPGRSRSSASVDGPLERRAVEPVQPAQERAAARGRSSSRTRAGPARGSRAGAARRAGPPRRRCRRRAARPADGAGEPGEQPQRRRLAGAVGAEQPEHRPRGTSSVSPSSATTPPG